jgi:hypothetical protein
MTSCDSVWLAVRVGWISLTIGSALFAAFQIGKHVERWSIYRTWRRG